MRDTLSICFWVLLIIFSISIYIMYVCLFSRRVGTLQKSIIIISKYYKTRLYKGFILSYKDNVHEIYPVNIVQLRDVKNPRTSSCICDYMFQSHK